MFKNVLFQAHWFLGITAGLVLALMGLTGALYSFQSEITDAVVPSPPLQAELAQADVMPLGELLQRLQASAEGRRVTVLRLELGDHKPSVASTVDENGKNRMRRYFDPARGVWLESDPARSGLEGFFALMLDLHRFLAMGDTGGAITGACTLVLLVSCATGLYLRWPRKVADWRAWLWLDWSRKGRSFQWDLHAIAGTWSLPLLLFLALTGLWWSYDWYRSGLVDMLGDGRRDIPMVVDTLPSGETPPIDHEGMWTQMQALAGPGMQTAIVNLSAEPGTPVRGSYRLRDAPNGGAYNHISFDPGSGRVLAHERYTELPLGERILSSMYALHVGEYFGMTGRILVTVVSLLMPLFLVTGLWLYLNRRGKRRKARLQRRALESVGRASGGENWLIGFASQSGTAEQLAWHTAGQLQAAGHPVKVQPLGRLGESDLAQARKALFIVSTFGEGDPPDSARGFERRLPDWVPDLGTLRYAVLALGDRQYEQFCGFARRMDAWLSGRGAQALFAPVEVDNGDTQALESWQQRLGEVTGITPAQVPVAVPFEAWRLVGREHMNRGSEGAPVCRVSLHPVAPCVWEAGDVLEVQVPVVAADGEASSVLREYSIASLPSEGRLDLMVRQARREDGQPGLGSGWLTMGATLGGEVQARVRCNRGFHAPEDDRPMVLVGNGTGMAGLRSLLVARVAAGHRRNWLLYGERSARCDFLCGDEIETWRGQGWLQRVDLAFSRDQPSKVYVQDRLREAADELRSWCAAGASIYVCGSLEGMAGGVDAALREVLGEDVVLALLDDGRYRRDVY